MVTNTERDRQCGASGMAAHDGKGTVPYRVEERVDLRCERVVVPEGGDVDAVVVHPLREAVELDAPVAAFDANLTTERAAACRQHRGRAVRKASIAST